MFPDLFAAIGTTYGAGDGSTTFNVPDYNAAKRFAQGDTVAGTVKSAGLPNITASMGDDGESVTSDSMSYSGAWSQTRRGTSVGGGNGNITWQGWDFDASRSNPIYGASNTVQPDALTARYIIKAFDGQTADSALIDITQYANELAGKANRQLSNLDTANLACHVVVDSYYDSTTGDWYRVYDDGWVEQGGIKATNSNIITTVTFLKPMLDTNYVVTVGRVYSGNGAETFAKVQTATTLTFELDMSKTCWMVCGMGAQS
jgi:microcystin-dependent protein